MLQVLEVFQQRLGPDHCDTLGTMTILGSLYHQQGRLEEAENIVKQVTETRNRVLGPDHPDTLHSKGDLAAIYQSQRQWHEAEALGAQVTESYKVLGPNHPKTLVSMDTLAHTWKLLGKDEAALHLMGEASGSAINWAPIVPRTKGWTTTLSKWKGTQR